jgi:hypothetical protein
MLPFGLFLVEAEFPIFEGLARFVNFLSTRAQVVTSSASNLRNSATQKLHRRTPDLAPARQPVSLVLL